MNAVHLTHGDSMAEMRATTYVERGDLCIAVVDEATRVVVGAVGGCRRAVEAEERAAAAAAGLLLSAERHHRRRRGPRSTGR